MVECAKCEKTGLKIRETIAAFIDGKPVFVCRKCANENIDIKKPDWWFEQPRGD